MKSRLIKNIEEYRKLKYQKEHFESLYFQYMDRWLRTSEEVKKLENYSLALSVAVISLIIIVFLLGTR